MLSNELNNTKVAFISLNKPTNHRLVIKPYWKKDLYYCSFFSIFTGQISESLPNIFETYAANKIQATKCNNILFDYFNSRIQNTFNYTNQFKNIEDCCRENNNNDKINALLCVISPLRIYLMNMGDSKAIIINNKNKLIYETQKTNELMELYRETNIKFIIMATSSFWKHITNEQVICCLSKSNRIDSDNDLKIIFDGLIDTSQLNNKMSVVLIALEQIITKSYDFDAQKNKIVINNNDEIINLKKQIENNTKNELKHKSNELLKMQNEIRAIENISKLEINKLQSEIDILTFKNELIIKNDNNQHAQFLQLNNDALENKNKQFFEIESLKRNHLNK